MNFHDYYTHRQLLQRNLQAELRNPKGSPRWRRRLETAMAIARDPDKFRAWALSCHKERDAHDMPLPVGEGGLLFQYDFANDPFTPELLQAEVLWQELGRPYYNVWPSVIPALSKLKLDADSSWFKLPLDHLLLRFPKENNPLTFEYKGVWAVHSVLASNVMLPNKEGTEYKRAISLWIDINEPLSAVRQTELEDGRVLIRKPEPGKHTPSLLYRHIICDEGKTIEWSFDNIPPHSSSGFGVVYPDPIVRDVARIVCTLCLLQGDPDLVEPIVLAKDEAKRNAQNEASLVDKAKRRGMYGWNLGRNVQVSPHVRSAHAHLYWTGKGRKIPAIRFLKATVVRRHRVSDVPTGYLDKE